jgi:WD40 repeat protein
MIWDLRKKPSELSHRTRPHTKQIMDLQKDQHSTSFISASKDCTSKVI